MTEDLKTHTESMKEELISAVTQSVIQQLDGAVIQSFKTTNNLSECTTSNKANPEPPYASRCKNCYKFLLLLIL